jgi:putative NADPH-quinone reductase
VTAARLIAGCEHLETTGLCGMETLEPFIVYGAKRHSETDKETNLENYKKRLTELVE